MYQEGTEKMDKSKLRKIMATLLKEVSEGDRQLQSQSILKQLIQHPKYREAERVSLYLSTQNEIDTIPILKHSLEVEKKRCFIPVIKPSPSKQNPETSMSNLPRMSMVELKSMSEYEQLPVNKYGIKEPDRKDLSKWLSAEPNSETDTLDLMLVPGVAFSAFGHRLGHGMGYYDEYLDHWNRQVAAAANGDKSPLYTIGLALRQQLIQNTMAVEGHDYKLDEVLFDGSIQL